MRIVAIAIVVTALSSTPGSAGRRFHGFHAHAGGGFHRAHFAREHCRWQHVDGERQRVCW